MEPIDKEARFFWATLFLAIALVCILSVVSEARGRVAYSDYISRCVQAGETDVNCDRQWREARFKAHEAQERAAKERRKRDFDIFIPPDIYISF